MITFFFGRNGGPLAHIRTYSLIRQQPNFGMVFERLVPQLSINVKTPSFTYSYLTRIRVDIRV